MKIENLNPWWFNGKIQDEYSKLKKRELFFEIEKYTTNKQIISLTGLRRVGKTVLFHHLIEKLLEKNPKEKILYFSFDMAVSGIEQAVKEYSEKLNLDLKKDRLFIFLDEIQKANNWENELKLLYDNYPNIKFFISGSATLFIEKKTKESLAGRILSFKLFPLSFKEYLDFMGINYSTKNIKIYSDTLRKSFEKYLVDGGFPEVINEEDISKINKYIFDLVMEKVIYIDIPSVFKVEEPDLLKSLFQIVCSNPGILGDYESLASDLKRNRKTISNYLLYLEKAFLIKRVYNFSSNLLTSEKKLKRFYPSSSSFCYLFDNPEIGKNVETSFLMNSKAKFFSRTGNKEVDFILTDKKKNLPIEIKYRNSINSKNIKPLVDFCKSKSLKKGVVLTKGMDKEETYDEIEINFIPIWNWFLQ